MVKNEKLNTDAAVKENTHTLELSGFISSNHKITGEISLPNLETKITTLTEEIKLQDQSLKNIAQPTIADWSIVITTVVSVLLASFALFHSIRESRERKHEQRKANIRYEREVRVKQKAEEKSIELQKLSVKPYLILETDHSLSKGIFEAYLINKGVGPAFIKDFMMHIDFMGIKSENPVSAGIYSVLPIERFSFDYKGIFGITGAAISHSDKILLYRVELSNFNNDFELAQQAHENLLRLGFGLTYESLYGDTFKTAFTAK